MQAILNQVWDKWTREYLPTLLTRAKWQFEERDAMVGDIVLMVDRNMPRNHWQMGRITKVFPGKDGRVRSVKVKTPDSEYERPIVRCCLLRPADMAPELTVMAEDDVQAVAEETDEIGEVGGRREADHEEAVVGRTFGNADL